MNKHRLKTHRQHHALYYGISLLAAFSSMTATATTDDQLKEQVAQTHTDLTLERNQLALEKKALAISKTQTQLEQTRYAATEAQKPAVGDNDNNATSATDTTDQIERAINQQENEATEMSPNADSTSNQTSTQPTSDAAPDEQADNQPDTTQNADTPEGEVSTDVVASETAPIDAVVEKSEAEKLLDKVAPAYDFSTENLSDIAQQVNQSTWFKGMKVNPHTTVKLQILLDWNHASPGPIDSGWGMNSRKALRAFQEKNGIKVDGRMSQALWDKLTEGELANRPALVSYTITEADVKTRFRHTARGYEGKSKMRRLSYNNIYEMFGERFHMNVNFLRKLNKDIPFKAGNKITVVNVGHHNTTEIDKVVADKRKETLYAYNGDTLVATYPTTVGSSKTPSPKGKHRITNKVYMPYYNATSKKDPKKKWVLPPGPNNPVGIVWIALSKRSYGIHGSPRPEGISRQASAGCVRLTNWDAAELYATIKKGATIVFKD